jgi:hypothetical protein
MSFHWKDAARDELETKAADDKRELMVHLFYPADAKAFGGHALYVSDADAVRARSASKMPRCRVARRVIRWRSLLPRRLFAPNPHQLFRVLARQRFQQHLVNNTENRRIRANPNANVKIAINEKPGFLRSMRKPNRKSCKRVSSIGNPSCSR